MRLRMLRQLGSTTTRLRREVDRSIQEVWGGAAGLRTGWWLALGGVVVVGILL